MHGYKWPTNSPRTHIEEEAAAAEAEAAAALDPAAAEAEAAAALDPAPEPVDGHHVDDELRRH